MGQYESAFAPTGDTIGRVPLAEVFFRTNSARLDRQDKKVISLTAQYFKGELWLGRAVRFYVMARTDHRGDAEYNRKLSNRRLMSVTEFLANLLKDEPRLTHFWGIAGGEDLLYESYEPDSRFYRERSRSVGIYPMVPSTARNGKSYPFRKYEMTAGKVRPTTQLRGWFELDMDAQRGR